MFSSSRWLGSEALSCLMFCFQGLCCVSLSLSLSVSDEQSSSEAVKRAAASLQITRQSLTGEENAHPDHNANLWPSDRPATEENQLNQIMKEPECKPNELKYRETADGRNLEQTGSETRTACWRRDTQEMTSEDDNKGRTASRHQSCSKKICCLVLKPLSFSVSQ